MDPAVVCLTALCITAAILTGSVLWVVLGILLVVLDMALS